MSTATSVSEKKNYHHGNLRQALMNTALQHIKAGGAEKLSLRAVARDLSVSQSAIYRHFSDKNSLLTAIVSQGFDMLRAAMQQAVHTHPDDPVLALRSTGRAYIVFACSHPETYRLMFGIRNHELETEELEACASDGYCILTGIIEDGLTKGIFKDIPSEQLALSAWSIVHGFASLAIDGQIARHAEKHGDTTTGLITEKNIATTITSTDDKPVDTNEALIKGLCDALLFGLLRHAP
ncbi:TetR/AcrR family transcriptional regulator [Flocculibacter collagenilyticus]|uniref:TetR/AcrR family transcriptional regulator n=1 Tax=Flocculibacter collagenilyticus TaxID=2744479 RepID=UPI0018F5C854|nr:TetR/AcrR family transcriptional regulator [Flocculibacter collagenilyticus]